MELTATENASSSFSSSKARRYLLWALLSVAINFLVSPIYTLMFDNSIFNIVGHAILEGRVVYQDIFDHKGPIMLLLNAFTQLAPGLDFALTSLMLAVSMEILWRFVNLFPISKLQGGLVMAITLIYFAATADLNNVENWSYLFNLYALYVGVKHLMDGTFKFSRGEAFLLGVCLAVPLLIRPNNCGIPAAVILFFGLRALIKAQWKTALEEIVWLLVGIAVVFIPILCYLAYHHAVSDMWFAYIEYNLVYKANFYSKIANEVVGVKWFIKSCGYRFALWLLPIAAICIRKKLKYSREILILSLVLFVVQYVALGFYIGLQHYYNINTPIVAFEFSLFAVAITNPKVRTRVLLIVSVIMLCPILLSQRNRLPYNRYLFGDQYAENLANDIRRTIPETDWDEIYTFGHTNFFRAIRDLGIIPMNKYFYAQQKQMSLHPKIKAEIVEYLANNRPKWIIMTDYYMTQECLLTPIMDDYQAIPVSGEAVILKRKF